MPRSSTRHDREIYGIDSAGESAWEHGEIPNVGPYPGPINIIRATLDITKQVLSLEFNNFVQGSTGFTLYEAGVPITLTPASVYRNRIDFTTGTLKLAVHTLDYTPGDVTTLLGVPLEAFSDYPVNSAGAGPGGGSALDMDGDGLLDTTLADNGTVHVSEDDDSVNIDLDGDDVADIVVPK